jgi:hypothetical protein
MKRLCALLILMVINTVVVLTPTKAIGFGGLVRKPAQELIEVVSEYILLRKGSRELSKELTDLGGETALRKITERTIREGGEQSMTVLLRLTKNHGPDVIRVMNVSAKPQKILKVINEIPEDLAGRAIRAMSAGQEGKALVKIVEKYGEPALKSELKHPGIGVRVINDFGQAGIELAEKLSTKEMLTLSRHSKDIAKLPIEQKDELIKMFLSYPDRMIKFIAKFIEQNPGKVLFTAATTTIILANSDNVLGDGTVIYGEDGDAKGVKKEGSIEKIVKHGLDTILSAIMPVIIIGLSLWIAIKLLFLFWYKYRLLNKSKNIKNRKERQKLNGDFVSDTKFN